MSGAIQIGRTNNGHTYTNAPVDVKLGPNTFHIPANYLDSQISPWSDGRATLVIEWPHMQPSPPGARAHPRTNDFRKEISALIDYVDRAPIETLLERYSSNEFITEPDWVERKDPRASLSLRLAQPETMGLTPYAIDEAKMLLYNKEYEARYGKPPTRNPAFEDDWYVARDAEGKLTTFITCDSKVYREKDGIRLVGDEVINGEERVVASCRHYFVDVKNKLRFRLDYYRAYLKDWKRMEDAFREILTRTKAQ